MRKCKCGSPMNWYWGHCTWCWICPQCGYEEEVKVPEVDYVRKSV